MHVRFFIGRYIAITSHTILNLLIKESRSRVNYKLANRIHKIIKIVLIMGTRIIKIYIIIIHI